ncbi:MAG: helicase-related protein [Sandaracinaceae bacterium]
MRGVITLALGPTNTGKTHRAVERLLEAESGMIGLPLRLLAREVYDRISARIGEREVALVTGEEKRVPPRPRYWVCTVEAMPEVEVDVLVVDEIQLAANRERGHVFTDRLLHARGREETWFLGAETMAPLLRELLPDSELRRLPRLSVLRHAGSSGLGGLPPRSATVAFSADEVYQLAGRLRGRRGGAAVVLGALSPRTRNAQVALYQSREVQHLVATDAIGMGLNLDIDHVAFASRRKFDGTEHRMLEPGELGQIAGRAGRHRRDGTFGTLNPARPMPPGLANAIEEHRFEPVQRLIWRNRDLDFGSLDGLIQSLAAPAPDARFTRVEQADDYDALRALARRDDVRARCTTEANRRLLWEVCQVPDYRKLLLLRHVSLLDALFAQLTERGRLDPGFVEQNLRRIDRIDGEVDHLTARLAAIRVWTYISHRDVWLEDSARWQAETRAIEDRLGDALHARLVERFVERRRKTRSGRVEVDESNPFAPLGTLLDAAHAAELARAMRWIDELVEAEHAAFSVRPDATVRFQDRTVAVLRGGREVWRPELSLRLDGVAPGAQTRIERRLVAFLRDWLAELAAPLAHPAEGALRGLLYQLREGLGTVSHRDAHAQLQSLSEQDQAALAGWSVRVGRRAVFATELLSTSSLERRAMLVRLTGGPSLDVSAPTVSRPDKASFSGCLQSGYYPMGRVAVRVDVLEDVLASLPDHPTPAALAGTLDASEDTAHAVLKGLGYRRLEDGRVQRARRRRRRR